MPSPEYYYQRRAEAPVPTPQLQSVMTDLAAYQEVDFTQAGAGFTFTRPDQDKHWLITHHHGQIDVARCPVNADFLVPDMAVLLTMTPAGWQTEKVVYSATAWQAYAEATSAPGQPREAPPVAFPFFAFASYVAQLLATELQAEQASDEGAVRAWLSGKTTD